jgi:hypothetical protein
MSAQGMADDLHALVEGRLRRIDQRYPSAMFERAISRQLDALADAEGFQPHSHRVDMLGLCASCQ